MQKRLCKGVAPFELSWQGYGFNTHKYQGGNGGKTENKMEDQAIGERISCYLVMLERSQQGNSCM